MTDEKNIQKLRALLSHWIRHNAGHADEYRSWARKAGHANVYLEAAAQHCEEANYMLQLALEHLGGPLEDEAEHEHGVPYGR